MRLGEYYQLREGLQVNAPAAQTEALRRMAVRLRDALLASGLFHTVEIDRTEDPDRLLVAMCGFAPDVDHGAAAEALARLWRGEVAYDYWAAEHLLVEPDQVELQGATRAGRDGHFATLHLVAQRSPVPARCDVVNAWLDVEPERPAPVPPQRRSRFARLGGLVPRQGRG